MRLRRDRCTTVYSLVFPCLQFSLLLDGFLHALTILVFILFPFSVLASLKQYAIELYVRRRTHKLDKPSPAASGRGTGYYHTRSAAKSPADDMILYPSAVFFPAGYCEVILLRGGKGCRNRFHIWEERLTRFPHPARPCFLHSLLHSTRFPASADKARGEIGPSTEEVGG